ncbi:AAA family ATPase [Candidatus Micrarchaeota archaeon]|nr:AAA family ATPase [Candidatus Micrarchaeota archaeon]MBU1166536.1 AAA family ATPase [Candidatus Micrarchaeota archaeon]MBU1887548.1 AAA family ATPase [Candidatus Micrarchaeota archaeon]
MLILVCGLPGTGKSSFSKELAKKIDGIHINSDIVRKKMFPNPTYTIEEKTQVYSRLKKETRDYLAKGKIVILDATFYQNQYRNMMSSTAESLGEKYYFVLCTLPEKEIEQRLKRRKSNVSDADYNVYLKLRDIFEPIEGRHLTIDMLLPLKKRVAIVNEFIGGKNEW